MDFLQIMCVVFLNSPYRETPKNVLNKKVKKKESRWVGGWVGLGFSKCKGGGPSKKKLPAPRLTCTTTGQEARKGGPGSGAGGLGLILYSEINKQRKRKQGPRTKEHKQTRQEATDQLPFFWLWARRCVICASASAVDMPPHAACGHPQPAAGQGVLTICCC
jgi:hypothetical protein